MNRRQLLSRLCGGSVACIVDPRDWNGYDPTGANAMDTILNAAIQQAITGKARLVVPSGFFVLDAPLLLYTAGFASIQMEGQGGTGQGGLVTAIGGVQFPNAAAFPNTTFYANFIDKPAMIINTGRSIRLSGFCLIGKNIATGVTPYPPSSDPTQYVTGGCRDSRYSPYAGICIDPFTCATPPDGGYPGFTYPVHAGSGSHDIVVENVFIGNFVVGIMNGPGTTNANGDDCTFRDVSIALVKIPYACGNSQARQVTFMNGGIGDAYCCFDTATYGTQFGVNPYVYGTNIGQCYSLINFVLGASIISGVYTESLVTLGRYAAPNSNNPPLIFENLSFQAANLNGFPVNTGPYCPPAMLIAGGPVLFSACVFYFTSNPVEAWNFVSNSQTANIVFESCIFTGSVEAHRIPPIGIMRGTSCATLINCMVKGAATGGQSQVVSDNLYRGNNSLSIVWGNGIGRLNATCQTNRVPDTNAEYVYVPPGAGVWTGSNINIGSITALILTASTVTFTKTNAGQFFCENDILLWSMLPLLGGTIGSVPALKIPVGGISGNNVTCNMLWDLAYYDTVANQPNATSVDLYMNQWAPTGPLTCTTNGTVNLTAVSPVNTLLPGDFIIGAGRNAADIPNTFTTDCTRVVSTDGAGNVTMSVAATGSHSGVGLRFGYLSPVTPVILTVATLPPGVKGLRYMVSDATAPTYGSTVVGSGAVTVPVFYDGTNWIVG